MRYLLLLGLLAGLADEAAAWGGRGHRLIAELAEKRLRAEHPGVMKRIAALLGPNVTLASIAVCADSIRDYVAGRDRPGVTLPPNCIVTEQEAIAMFPSTGSWHFINIPVPAAADPSAHPNGVIAAACSANGSCITARIEHFTAQLKNRKLDTRTRAIALLFLTHLVGDLHQPLHAVARNNDRGGNDIFVQNGAHIGKLHAVWDTFFLDSIEARNVERLPVPRRTDPETWAWESYEAALRHVYPAVPLQPSRFENPIVLPHPAYRDNAVQVIQARLRAASFRLAELLARAL